jgi:hypothetical protein
MQVPILDPSRLRTHWHERRLRELCGFALFQVHESDAVLPTHKKDYFAFKKFLCGKLHFAFVSGFHR